ncbi:MAG: type II toxin-antitoxin system RelE/ParE family toxin [Gammaproteobacteria bacterium]|nr:type II toxin-antitoxin system RelE/ParE family toxin [Gammaproteobacteria bacterium]
MIRKFKHRGLERFFLTGSKSGIQAAHVNRIRLILGRLNVSAAPADMGLPGLYLHELKGQQAGRWSVRVSGNWRITFKFEGPDAIDVDYEDYH